MSKSLPSRLALLVLVAGWSGLWAQRPGAQPSFAGYQGVLTIPAFSFDTTKTRSINVFQSNIGVNGLVADPCYVEMRAGVNNNGTTNANCHIVYIPLLSGTFGSNNSLQVDATFSAIRNASNQGAGKLNASATLSSARCISNHAQCWDETLQLQDTTGDTASVLLGAQVNMSPQNAPTGYATATVAAFNAVMFGTNLAGAVGQANWCQKAPAAVMVWQTCLVSSDSGAAIFAQAGALGSQASQNSQPYDACYRNAGDTEVCSNLLQYDFVGNLDLCIGCAGATNAITTNIVNSQLYAEAGILQTEIPLTCGAATAPAIDVRRGTYFTCDITSNVAVVVAVPAANPGAGRTQRITVALYNGSGGALTTAPTFNTSAGGYKGGLTLCNPTNGTQCLWTFVWDVVQGFWYETSEVGPY